MAQKNTFSHRHTCKDGFGSESCNLDKECDFCFFVSKTDQMTHNIQVIKKNPPLNPLYNLIAKLGAEKVIANSDGGQSVINKLKKLATEYALLETKTQRAVMTIQSYGENWKEAAEDFLKDGNTKDLWNELGNIKETKKSLQDATNQHKQIK
jgi:hypothetical protein